MGALQTAPQILSLFILLLTLIYCAFKNLFLCPGLFGSMVERRSADQ